MNVLAVFSPLRNPRFARLYLAQTVSQLGDALTWVGLALLAYQLAGGNASEVLGLALTLRVAAFVIFSPLAGVIADRIDRKWLLIGCDLGRCALVGLLPFVSSAFQVYILMFLVNALTAFFTPTNQASVPLVMGREDAGSAFALSSATTELLGIVGPGLAGLAAAVLGGRNLFFLDAASFLGSGLLLLTLPSLRVARSSDPEPRSPWRDVRDGTARLWRDPPIRFALLMELVASLAGALILVQTVTRVKTGLNLGDLEYGWTMAAYGLGATLASLGVAALGKRFPRTTFIRWGAILTVLAVLPGDIAPLAPLMGLWLLAGVGQNWVNLPTETLLAERTEAAAQGRVYGAHFAWSHLWWAFAYPLVGWLGGHQSARVFLYGGLVALGVLLLTQVLHLRSGDEGKSALEPERQPR